MSIFDIDAVFSYVFPTSSVDYVRNYNFNTTTATNLPLLLINSDTDIPITVNITTTDSWVEIRDPNTAVNLKYPIGNVVLQPTSSKLVFVKVDLPPEIENISGSITVRPNILLDVKSGSFAIVPPRVQPAGSEDLERIDVSTDAVIVYQNEQIPVEFTIYDEKGVPDFTVTLDEISYSTDDPAIARIVFDAQIVTSYSPINVVGVGQGETKLNISAKGYSRQIDVRVLPPRGSGSSKELPQNEFI